MHKHDREGLPVRHLLRAGHGGVLLLHRAVYRAQAPVHHRDAGGFADPDQYFFKARIRFYLRVRPVSIFSEGSKPDPDPGLV